MNTISAFDLHQTERLTETSSFEKVFGSSRLVTSVLSRTHKLSRFYQHKLGYDIFKCNIEIPRHLDYLTKISISDGSHYIQDINLVINLDSYKLNKKPYQKLQENSSYEIYINANNVLEEPIPIYLLQNSQISLNIQIRSTAYLDPEISVIFTYEEKKKNILGDHSRNIITWNNKSLSNSLYLYDGIHFSDKTDLDIYIKKSSNNSFEEPSEETTEN